MDSYIKNRTAQDLKGDGKVKGNVMECRGMRLRAVKGRLTGLLDHVRDDATHEVRFGLPQHSHQVGKLLLEGTNTTTKTTQQHVHTHTSARHSGSLAAPVGAALTHTKRDTGEGGWGATGPLRRSREGEEGGGGGGALLWRERRGLEHLRRLVLTQTYKWGLSRVLCE